MNETTTSVSSSGPTDRRRQRGERTRNTILSSAVDLGSREGLESLTIGRLASDIEISKSGLFAHFGSKEELQLATVDAAREVFLREVVYPSSQVDEGLPRLRALLEAWISYFRRDVFPGGCFFQAASLEFDGRPGPVRQRVAEIMGDWLNLLTQLVEAAGVGAAPASQLAFEINAIGLATNWQHQLLGDDQTFQQATNAFDRLIGSSR